MKKIDKEAMKKGYVEMAKINLAISEDSMYSESSNKYNDGGKFNGR